MTSVHFSRDGCCRHLARRCKIREPVDVLILVSSLAIKGLRFHGLTNGLGIEGLGLGIGVGQLVLVHITKSNVDRITH